MLEYILQGFYNILDPNLILLIIISIIGGIVIGTLPGFSPTMGVALLVPFTFAMKPVEGLTVLAGVYVGAVYGGSISAILLNIPGAPANIATLLDGYPMAQKGESRKALLVSAFSSVHGGIISAICLLILAPSLAIVALKFGPAEKFWVAILGLVIIAGLGSGKDMIKGLAAGIFGMWLGTIGTSPTTGEPRFTLGFAELWGGIDLIPVLVGLFAFSQVIIYFENIMLKGAGSAAIVSTGKENLFKLYKNIWKYYSRLTLYSGILGSLIGVIPGAGGQVGGIVAYDHAKRFSKNKSLFGTGQIEGIIAPETANNATVGGSIVPLLTLGIPGSPTAAVLLGGLLIHGLWPGPLLFTENAEITYTFMAAFFISQFILLFVAVAFLGFASNILNVCEYYMGPVIIALCLFGAFAVNNNFFDIYIMLIMGILGYLLIKTGFTPTPMVLGVILGPIAEQNFLLGSRIGMAKDGVWNYFFTSPISIFFIVIIAVIIVSTFWSEIKNKTTNQYEKPLDNKKSFLSFDAILGVLFIVLPIIVWQFYLVKLSYEASIFPIVIMILISIIGLTQLFYAIFIYSDRVKPFSWKVLLEIAISTLTAVHLANVLGFYTVTFLLVLYIGFRMLKLAGRDEFLSKFKMFIYSVCVMYSLYAFFRLILYLPTPTGVLL